VADRSDPAAFFARELRHRSMCQRSAGMLASSSLMTHVLKEAA